ncbi:MAG: hypothetical protein K0R26_2391 [Bacteroidota bacterium]|jgi:hypothetical protein|nr:hypothetical protein [Bacteroidota bacterium]
MTELTKIFEDGHIDTGQYERIRESESNRLFSIHWELRTILYLGVLLLSSGFGYLIYLNIDTIGHQAILLGIAAVAALCFYYVWNHKLPYQNQLIIHASPFFDYIILLGSLLFALFIGYFQYQYEPFGSHYGFLVLIPTLLFFYCAYRFDHKGILSMAITGLAGSLGLSTSPRQILEDNDFSDLSVVFTALLLGLALAAWAWYSDRRSIKKHFNFTFQNFSVNLLSIAALSALFGQDLKVISLAVLLVICLYFIRFALQQRSYLFFLLPILYGYIGFTYFVFYLLSMTDMNEATFFVGLCYVIASAIGVILLFLNLKKIIKK